VTRQPQDLPESIEREFGRCTVQSASDSFLAVIDVFEFRDIYVHDLRMITNARGLRLTRSMLQEGSEWESLAQKHESRRRSVSRGNDSFSVTPAFVDLENSCI
jgi:hypothetical protein